MCLSTNDTDDTSAQGGRGQKWLPETPWSKVLATGAEDSPERSAALDYLLQRYWKPVYCYVRRRGYREEDAKDLVQDFFEACLRHDFFAQADPARGRFRNFLLTALQHFLANAHRAAHAQKRRPPQGVVSLEQVAASDRGAFQAVVPETPEDVFHRVWVADLTQRVLSRLEQECRATGKQAHYELLRQRLLLPALDNAAPPPLRELAERFGLSEKQAANCLLTARRAYQRLLREEIRDYVSNEDEMAAEIRDLFHYLSEAARA